jgi:hypothetical protein
VSKSTAAVNAKKSKQMKLKLFISKKQLSALWMLKEWFPYPWNQFQMDQSDLLLFFGRQSSEYGR